MLPIHENKVLSTYTYSKFGGEDSEDTSLHGLIQNVSVTQNY